MSSCYYRLVFPPQLFPDYGRPLLIEIPQWAESRTFDALFSKYRGAQRRTFQDEEVRRVVCALSLIVKLWSFGCCTWATDAATLLDMSEPLECLSAGDLPVRKMRIFQLVYSKRFDEAHKELEQTCCVFGEDMILARMRIWLHALEGERKR
jgi:hypothetical protein